MDCCQQGKARQTKGQRYGVQDETVPLVCMRVWWWKRYLHYE